MGAQFGIEPGTVPSVLTEGVATIAMNVFGLGELAHIDKKALRYTLGLPVSSTIVGCSTLDQLRRDLQIANHLVPLSGVERLELFREVLPLVKPENLPWKADDWDDPKSWHLRTEPAPI
jgi:hypothetical protein